MGFPPYKFGSVKVSFVMVWNKRRNIKTELGPMISSVGRMFLAFLTKHVYLEWMILIFELVILVVLIYKNISSFLGISHQCSQCSIEHF